MNTLCCCYCGYRYLRSVPEIVHYSADEALVRLLLPPPAPTLESVMLSHNRLHRILQYLNSGRKLQAAQEEWGRAMRRWEAAWWCERCASVCLFNRSEAGKVERMWEFLKL